MLIAEMLKEIESVKSRLAKGVDQGMGSIETADLECALFILQDEVIKALLTATMHPVFSRAGQGLAS